MKNCDFIKQRNKELISAYRKSLANEGYPIVFKRVIHNTCNSDCSRFWVSPERAYDVIRKILKGDDLRYMQKSRREMFFAIFNKVLELKKNNDKRLSVLCEMAVESPAPSFYLESTSAKIILHNAIKKERCEKLKR